MVFPNLTDALISSKDVNATFRIGILIKLYPDSALVNIGGTNLTAAWIVSSYPLYAGDIVACIRQESSWVVLGRLAGSGGNLILDPGFEDQPVGTVLPNGAYSSTIQWSLWDYPTGGAPTGATTAVYTADQFALEGSQVLRIGPIATAQNVIALSSPISVLPDEEYVVVAFAGGDAQPEVPTGDAQLFACWFSSDTETWRSGTLTTDATFIAEFQNVPNAPSYSRLAGSVHVPSAIPTDPTVMRIGIRANVGVNIGMRFGITFARKTGV